ncbi:MAG: hypothetical protein AAF657_34220, partial [Acidobacteriota bacterium]
RINEAINLAVESGARDTLLAVAIAAGRASQHLGRPGDAEEAYRRALEIAGENSGSTGGDVPATLELALHLGLWETATEPPVDSVTHCLSLLPEALDDAETWWRLRRIDRMVVDCQRHGIDLSRDTQTTDGFDSLQLAVGQRQRAHDPRRS